MGKAPLWSSVAKVSATPSDGARNRWRSPNAPETRCTNGFFSSRRQRKVDAGIRLGLAAVFRVERLSREAPRGLRKPHGARHGRGGGEYDVSPVQLDFSFNRHDKLQVLFRSWLCYRLQCAFCIRAGAEKYLLLPSAGFGTMRGEPIKGLFSTREALPMRCGGFNGNVEAPCIVGTIYALRHEFGKTVLVFNPHTAVSEHLRRAATYYAHIPRDLPAKCQLPDIIPVGTHGRTIHRPEAWAAPASAQKA